MLDIYYDACSNGRIKIVKYLSSKSFVDDTVEKKGYELAKKNWQYEVMRYFSLKGFEIIINVFLVRNISNKADLEFLEYILSFKENKNKFIKIFLSLDENNVYNYNKIINSVLYKNHYITIKYLIKKDNNFITHINKYLFLIIFHDDMELFEQYFLSSTIALNVIFESVMMCGAIKILKFLLERYKNFIITDNLFAKAIKYGQNEIIEYLFLHNKLLSTNYETILFAVDNKKFNTINKIITIGINIIKIKDTYLFDIFKKLIQNNNCDVLQLLLTNNHIPNNINILIRLTKNKIIQNLLKSYIPIGYKICYN
ncbi:hypothetical protein CE11_01201 [Megavirus courdo11]|uniref:Ankyrin repeat protein n=1 Tax=Megavirus courdo11 TaxID=1128140 RepID=K7YGL6_9VIRU|nr:hypothetical protein CE11_01201 [Megavirus courdo11]